MLPLLWLFPLVHGNMDYTDYVYDKANTRYSEQLHCAYGVTQDQSRTCSRSTSSEVFPLCIYMKIRSTKTEQGYDWYDCVNAQHLPGACTKASGYFTPYWNLTVNGVSRLGSLYCCSMNYCNALTDLMLTSTREYRDSAVAFESFMFTLILVLIITACIFLYCSSLFYERSKSSRRRREMPHYLYDHIFSSLACFIKEIRLNYVVKMRFRNLPTMMNVIRTMKNPWKNINFDDHDFEIKPPFYPYVLAARSDDDYPCDVIRSVLTTHDGLLFQMIEHGPFRFDFDSVELSDLFDAVTDIFAVEPSVLEIPGKTIVMGSIDGDYGQIYRFFNWIGWPPKVRVLFLGNLTSPESSYSLEALALIFAMKKEMPNHIYILRGAAEIERIHIEQFRFSHQETELLSANAMRAFSFLPLAAIVAGKYFCAHGGVPLRHDTIDKIKKIRRPILYLSPHTLAAHVVMSQPHSTDEVTPDGRGKYIEPKSWTVTGDIQLLVRARNPVEKGFVFIGQSLTLCSSSFNSKAAAVLFIRRDKVAQIYKLYKHKEWNQPTARETKHGRSDTAADSTLLTKNSPAASRNSSKRKTKTAAKRSDQSPDAMALYENNKARKSASVAQVKRK